MSKKQVDDIDLHREQSHAWPYLEGKEGCQEAKNGCRDCAPLHSRAYGERCTTHRVEMSDFKDAAYSAVPGLWHCYSMQKEDTAENARI